MNALTLPFTTLRLTNKHREQGGQWFYTDRNLAYARSLLVDIQRAEPGLDWHLECRGTIADWHRWQDDAPLGVPSTPAATATPDATSTL